MIPSFEGTLHCWIVSLAWEECDFVSGSAHESVFVGDLQHDVADEGTHCESEIVVGVQEGEVVVSVHLIDSVKQDGVMIWNDSEGISETDVETWTWTWSVGVVEIEIE